MKLASFFAGVGGIDLGFEQAGFKSNYANEINPMSCKTYELNFDINVDCRDIKSIKGSDVPNSDIFLAGFPCQPFSVAGYREGFNDLKNRGTVFFELLRIIKSKMPSVILLENVKNLSTHDNGNTLTIISNSLSHLGYNITYKVLNASEYGNIPQNRERIYIVCFLDIKKFKKFTFPEKIELTNTIHQYINFERKEEEKYYYSKSKNKFFNELKENITSMESVYQWRRKYVRMNKSNLCPTLTANMGTGGHNVPLIKTENGIRKLTPRECFNLQGFPNNFKLPSISNTKLYEQAGNSVVIPVINRIAKKISEVF